MSQQTLGLHVLRLSLAGVFLWFGFSQLIDSLSWVGIVPQWAINLSHLPPAMIVMLNGVFEITLGAALAMGFFVRIVSVLLALHLAVIAFEFGLKPTGIRDFGLTMATVALALMYPKKD